jgi:hypothetical protein
VIGPVPIVSIELPPDGVRRAAAAPGNSRVDGRLKGVCRTGVRWGFRCQGTFES